VQEVVELKCGFPFSECGSRIFLLGCDDRGGI
jgi:hypothetical protein